MKILPDTWKWYQLIVAGILLTVGSRLVDPVVAFAMRLLQQAGSG